MASMNRWPRAGGAARFPLEIAGVVLVTVLLSCGNGSPRAPNADPVVAASVVAASGAYQWAPPGTDVGNPPTVAVKDEAGLPVAGVSVNWAVTAGGGRLSAATTVTGADGTSGNGWMLGADVGMNTVTATVDALAPVEFVAFGARTSPDLLVTISSPSPGQVVATDVAIAVTLSSRYQVASVAASLGGPSVSLAPGPSGGAVWRGTLPLAGIGKGRALLSVTATDVQNATADAFVLVEVDRPPAVTVTSPVTGAFTRGPIDVAATCTDDSPAGCSSLVMSVGTIQVTGTGNLQQTVDLSPYDGNEVLLTFTGTDDRGGRTVVTRRVWVSGTPKLELVRALPGDAWDYSGNRFLYVDSSGVVPALCVLDGATLAVQRLDEDARLTLPGSPYGFLTPAGAIYLKSPATGDSGNSTAYEWRGSSPISLGWVSGIDTASLRVAGTFATYVRPDGRATVVRDLAAGSSTDIVLPSQRPGSALWSDVASNGDVVFAVGEVFRRRAGMLAAITSGEQAYWPLTDGSAVVYAAAATSGIEIRLWNGGASTLARFATDNVHDLRPLRSYAIANGWVAYVKPDASQIGQVWRQSSSGQEQLTQFGNTSTINLIASDGTVYFTNGSAALGYRRYRAKPGAALDEVGIAQGRMIERDGEVLLLLGPYVFRYVP